MIPFRRTIRRGGCAFRELTREPVHLALARGGSKDYRVTFPDGTRMTISVAPDRPFADLVPSPVEEVFAAAAAGIRPGARVAACRVLSGEAGAMLAARVGPSGGVVALDPDAESIRFARRRWARLNVSFEPGGIELLDDEPASGFDACLAIGAVRPGEESGPTVASMTRLVRPGGWLAIAQPLALPTLRTMALVGEGELAASAAETWDEVREIRLGTWSLATGLAR